MDVKYHKDVRLRQPDRKQMRMESLCPDDLIPADHPARTIWAAAEKLDLSKFYGSIQSLRGKAGRDATDPRLLVALWLYACTRGVGSARELSRLCQESAPYRWLCGGVSVNHHSLSDFRVSHAEALDELFTQVLAILCHRKLVTVERISQDGTRVRACAGASSYRRRPSLERLLKEARAHVQSLRALLDDPAASACVSARQAAARQRAAREREERLAKALEQLPALEARQEKLAKKVSKKDKQAGKLKAPRVSTTDAQARVMKMGDGGYRPAVNVQFATDTQSRAIVGVAVTDQGVDTEQAPPMREQVEQRTGRTVREHLVDGGYLTLDDIEQAASRDVTMYVPPKPPRNQDQRRSEYEPRPTDSQAVRAWRERMGSPAGQEIYRQRASTVETVNADLKTHRGLGQMTVRGLGKARCVALWCALAYNLLHFGQYIVG
jgi:transposase